MISNLPKVVSWHKANKERAGKLEKCSISEGKSRRGFKEVLTAVSSAVENMKST